jgi:hypothetical protein
MDITEKEFEKALCPEGMHSKDRKDLASCFTDVSAMPGAYRKSEAAEKPDMLESVFEGAVNIIAQATGKSAVIANGQWRTATKTRLRGIKLAAELMQISDEIHQTQATIFEQQDDSVQTFLHRLHYSSSEIRVWQQIIADSFTNYVHLIQMLLHWSTLHGYANELAERMLDYHATQLHQIRT